MDDHFTYQLADTALNLSGINMKKSILKCVTIELLKIKNQVIILKSAREV